MEKRELSYTDGGNVNFYRHYGEQYGDSLRKKAAKLELLYDPVHFPGNSAGKESVCNAGDPNSIPGSGRSPEEGIGYSLQYSWASLVAQLVKNHLQCRSSGFDPWVGKIPWRRTWQPPPVFLPGESPGRRSLAGCSPWGCKEPDTI